jgi:hypothetical protein
MPNLKKKIIGFDSWTGGVKKFERLLPAMEAQNMDFTLVHISSWGNYNDFESECRLGKVLARDISFYGSNSLEVILDRENPDAVILLSTDVFAHRAIIRFCNYRGIPTLNLYHGVLGVLDTSSGLGAPKISKISFLKHALSRVPKLTRYIFPNYIFALVSTKAKLKDWMLFIRDIFRLARGFVPVYGVSAPDSRTTKCAVYLQEDVNHAQSCYGFNEDDIMVVGNPDLSAFHFEEKAIGSWTKPLECDKAIMYIEAGFSSVGLVFKGTDGFIKHIKNTSNALNSQGYKMLLKLKPSKINTKLIKKALSGSNIELIENDQFLTSLMLCDAVIAETSSLALLPALLGMPLLCAEYWDLKRTKPGPLLRGYPLSYPLFDISNVSNILNNSTENVDKQELIDWFGINVGPRPFDDMPKRVAAIIEEMIVTENRPIRP